jgi:hypothetical protein
MFSCHIIIAQADYNKIEKGKKNGVWKGFTKILKDPGMRGLSSMEKKLSFNFMMIRKQNR